MCIIPKITVVRLQQVKDLVEKGWCQKFLATEDSYCLLGAIYQTSFEFDVDLMDMFLNVIFPGGKGHKTFYPHSVCDTDMHKRMVIAQWNDKPGRKKEEVLAVIDEVIKSCCG